MKRFSHPFMHLLVLAMWSLALMVLAVIIGMVAGISEERVADSPTTFLLWNIIVQLMTFAFPVLIVTRIYYHDSPLFSFRFPSLTSWKYVLAGVVVMLLLVPLTDWLGVWNDSWHFSGAWEKLEHGLRSAGEQSQQMVDTLMRECHPLLSLLGMALIPALCEELFFRAGVQNLLRCWFKNPHAAVWVTAAVFSLAHGEVFAFLPRFLLGALLGYLYLYGRSLWVNVTAHFVNNAIIVLAYVLMTGEDSQFDPSQSLAVPVVATVACTLAAAALFWFAFLRNKNQEKKVL